MELAYRDCNPCGTKSSYSCFDGGRVAAVNPRRPSIEADAEALHVVASTRRLVHSRDDPVSVPCSSSRDTLTVDEHDRALAFWIHSHRADDVPPCVVFAGINVYSEADFSVGASVPAVHVLLELSMIPIQKRSTQPLPARISLRCSNKAASFRPCLHVVVLDGI